MDEDVREKISNLMAEHRYLEGKLKENGAMMLELVWPLLTTKAACEELLKHLRGFGELRYHVENRKRNLPF